MLGKFWLYKEKRGCYIKKTRFGRFSKLHFSDRRGFWLLRLNLKGVLDGSDSEKARRSMLGKKTKKSYNLHNSTN
ncbi:MAG: hypothetical protein GF383_15775 [Candidatus Lokiarchaeota archaeon]|nr:hypothetical protein [Candidatus Lokiarchaeota archaeon]